jgi:predicted RNase H-like HicB family nuclease
LPNARSACDSRDVTEYQIILTREGRKWTAEVPALPGCVTWGTGKQETLRLAHEAIEAWLESRRTLRKRIPRTQPNIELARVRVG